MKKWKQSNWEKYWKNKWDTKMGEQNSEKYIEMRKIMNELGETQFKTAKLIMQIADKKSDEEFNREINNIEKKIKTLSDDIDQMLEK